MTATTSSAAPTTAPSTARPAPVGDLTIHLAGSCTWYQDTLHTLWLNPTLAATWTVPGAFPANAFNMRTSVGTRTAGGPISSTASFTWAIGGEPTTGNAFLGHTVIITVTIDPVLTVAETNETNNTTTIAVSVPDKPPPTSGLIVAVSCS